MSLRARMALFAGAAVAIAVVAVVVAGYRAPATSSRARSTSRCRAWPSGRSRTSALGPGGGPPPNGVFQFGPHAPSGNAGHDPDEGLGFDHLPPQAFGGASGTFTLFKRGGGTYVPKGQSYEIPSTPAIKKLAAAGQGQFFTDMRVKGTHIRVLVTGIGDSGRARGRAAAHHDRQRGRQPALLLLVIAAAGILLAVLLGLLVARTALAPITRFTRQTESIAPTRTGSSTSGSRSTGGDELARLARTFNETLDALEQSVQSQRNLVADASHELRTPIATIRANLQLMRDEQLLSPEDRERAARGRDRGARRADRACRRRSRARAREQAERGAGRRAARRDRPATRSSGAAGGRHGWTCHQAIEPTLVSGEADRIARAVTNLLDNAAKWSPEGGRGRGRPCGRGVVTVRDHGPGFNDEDLPFVFDRFHRARDARSKPGSGLGLAIVRQAAEAHGGFVEAANAPDGGAILRVSFGPPVELEEIAAEEESAVGGEDASRSAGAHTSARQS